MTRNRGYENPNQIQQRRGNYWFDHYYQYLTSLAYQLFEWENLPDSIDPRFMEMCLHMFGYVGFFNDPKLGYIATQGAYSGKIDHYWNPTEFHATSPTYHETFPLYHYADMKEPDKQGVIIWNNDYHFSTLPSLHMFAQDLTEIKEVTHVNRNAQKTPVLIAANDDTKYSLKQVYNQYEGNSPVMFVNENVDPDAIKVFKTDAPYIVDKMHEDKNNVWNEIMTFLGIKNANTEKKERQVTDEVNSNDEQIQASANLWLKAREEAANRINALYGLDLKVQLRTDIVEEFSNNMETVGGDDRGV